MNHKSGLQLGNTISSDCPYVEDNWLLKIANVLVLCNELTEFVLESYNRKTASMVIEFSVRGQETSEWREVGDD